MKLERVVLWQVAERPQTYLEIADWFRARWPRVWPGAIGAAICRLNRGGWIEINGGRWRIRRG